ncbi:MAG: hypothetical protein COX36_02575 [Candidatus Nealsonbacteria bacterium CG23_combo_of_CG06-09_8_20_14_all_38_19]|uniref:J domain-containing protein n=1 Tax=Candidatus Nealsonbacteria bacterium CG23_combo_of_CG06-09_8_20_14_all_38_19 TaxID=1974721 RepID=A0A2G9YWL6_9BACT|nr:MAG: hypothetical protein COX36_02575 [Candidatus Nealsonbacteria bacterium CG23_combo_of_CG06-09_8_20_14_all_38_19]
MKNYYEILQVSKNAEPEVIQAAYRGLSKKYHPDGDEPDEERMKEINEAYEVLGDSQKRAAYDASRQSNRSARAGAKAGATAGTTTGGYSGGSDNKPNPPIPKVQPEHLKFLDVKTGEGSFEIWNTGGELKPSHKPRLTLTVSWIEILNTDEITRAFQSPKGWPIKVKIRVAADNLEPGEEYTGSIVVDLGGPQTAEVKVFFRVAALAKPRLGVTPTLIGFGRVRVGEIKWRDFRIENYGGPAKNPLRVTPLESWIQVTPKGSGLPLEVEVKIDTSSLAGAQNYEGEILIKLDDEEKKVRITLETESTWVFSQWSWTAPYSRQLRLAVIGILLMPLLTILSATKQIDPSGVPVFLFLTLILVPVGIYGLVATNFLKEIESAPPEAKLANGVSIVVGGTTAIIGLLEGLLLWIVLIILCLLALGLASSSKD